MSGWPNCLLGEIASVQMGQSPPGETYNARQIGLPFFQGKAEFADEHPIATKWCDKPTRVAEAGDILLSVRAPVGPTNVAAERCCIGRGLAAIRSKPELAIQRYVRYYLKRFESDLASRGVGSTFTAINRRDIEQLIMPVPPLSEQERIVKLLDEADALRKLRAEADRRTADLIPALFHDMFGDPATNPNRWPLEKLAKVVSQTEQRDPRKSPDSMFWYVDIAGVDSETKKISNVKQFRGSDAPSRARKAIQSGDVIVSTVRPNLNAVAIVPDHLNNEICSTGFSVLRPSRHVMTEYLFAIACSPFFVGYLVSKTTGANYPAVNDGDVKGLQIPVPPLPLQKEFAARVVEIRAMEAAQSRSKKRLDDLFQSMLHRAFAGEL